MSSGFRYALALGLVLLAAPPALAERPGIDASEWRDEVDKIDETLRAGKWKPGKRAATKLAFQVVRQSWYGVGLREILSELAFLRAVAAANLGKREEALWYWFLAQNVDFRIRKKDPTPYGEAGKLLREFPLRRRGEVPAGFQVVKSTFGRQYLRAVRSKEWIPTIPLNAGARIEGVGDMRVELVVDRDGRPHHPVMVSTHLHPVVVYGALDLMWGMPSFTPARDSGKPVDSLYEFSTSFHFERWDQGGPVQGPRIN